MISLPIDDGAADGTGANPSAEAAEPDEVVLLAMLAELVRAGRVGLAIDRRKLGHIDFPLALEADANRWVYLLTAATVIALWQLGPTAGCAAAALALALYFTFGKRDVAQRLERRVRDSGLASVRTWRRLWRFGGVILTAPDGTRLQGPDGSWMRLVRDLTRGSTP